MSEEETPTLKISFDLGCSLCKVINRDTTMAVNRLKAVLKNYLPSIREKGFDQFADNLEKAINDVIGYEDDPSRPGALGRMKSEVGELIDSADVVE